MADTLPSPASPSQDPRQIPSIPPVAPEVKRLVTLALEISDRRAKLLAEMKKALLSGREKEALLFARWLCGLDEPPSLEVKNDAE